MTMDTFKYCPITANMPFSCTKEGFKISCDKFREHCRKKTKPYNKYCGICQGTIPDNVTFITLLPGGTIKEMEKAMPESTKQEKQSPPEKLPVQVAKQKTCDSCGKERNLKHSKGKIVCSSCQVTRIACSNHPELVLNALREFGNMPEGVAVDSGEVDKLKLEVVQLSDIAHERLNIIDELKKKIAVHQQQYQGEINELKEENEIIRTKLAYATNVPSDFIVPEIGQVSSRDSAILDLALGVLEGKISGIDSSTLQSLR